MSLKLIVLGSVQGRLEAAFQKLAALHAKNNFTCCIATGDLFSDAAASAAELDRLLAGQITVPVRTYFTVGTRPFPAAVVARLTAAAAEAERGDGAKDGDAPVADDAADGAELCPNVTFLGRRSVTKTADGLRIVALGGVEADESETDDARDTAPWRPFHTRADAAVLRGAHHADVLLTALWPRGVWRGSRVALPAAAGSGGDNDDDKARLLPASEAVADLAAALRPRYHLTAAPILQSTAEVFFYYEREPFVHPARTDSNGADSGAAADVTRFLALAPWANPAKAKALYAFSLPLGSGSTPAAVPAGCTPSPFKSPSNPRKRPPLEPEPFSRFAQENGMSTGGGGRRGGGKRRRGPPPPPGPDQCYFCLANPNLPTHMVCSIGTDAYLATAKGPLPEASTWADVAPPGLGFPGHMLVVPLNHAPTLAVAADADDAAAHAAAAAATRATFREMTRFRRALQAMLAGASGGRLAAVTWEISRQRNVHVHWQTVPVPAAMAADNLVTAAFRVEAANLGLPPLEETTTTLATATAMDDTDADADAAGDDGDDGNNGGKGAASAPVLAGDTFRVWVWTPDAGGGGGGRETTLVMRLDPAQRFDLQLGRRVVAKLLGLETTRAVWQECAQTEAEETADVAAFRTAFAPYDFTLED